MSDPAETQRVVDSFKAADAEKMNLEKKLKALGESLNAFARTLSNPDAHVFLVNENDSIIVGEHTNAQPRRPVARVTPDQIDWKDLCQMVGGYGKAREYRQRSVAQLKGMGIPVAEK